MCREGHQSISSVFLYLAFLFELIIYMVRRGSQSMDDQCPVCKSDRYLNPKLRLLVSSCYHKMCVAHALYLPSFRPNLLRGNKV